MSRTMASLRAAPNVLKRVSRMSCRTMATQVQQGVGFALTEEQAGIQGERDA
jgi:hypothetical protein